MLDEVQGRRRERSGREARREARSGGQAGPGRPYIVRNIPTYDIISEERLLRIEATADRILAEIGIEFRDDETALGHWRKAGAKVDGVLVRFEPGMLRRGVFKQDLNQIAALAIKSDQPATDGRAGAREFRKYVATIASPHEFFEVVDRYFPC